LPSRFRDAESPHERGHLRAKTVWTEGVRAVTISAMSVTLDPSPILQTAFGFWSSKVLLSAVELGVFTILKDRKAIFSMRWWQ
jgi:hypothetical protein